MMDDRIVNILALFMIMLFSNVEVNSQDFNEISNIKSASGSFGVKGGTTKGGGFSKFKESITSIQQRQQQAAVLSQQNIKTISTIIQKPLPAIKTSSFDKQVTIEESTSSGQQQNQFQQEAVAGDSEPAVYGSVQGKPGVDFPNYTGIPNTKFSCDSVPFDPGMYADESTACQVYHLCYQGRKESFLCGIGTVFNQAIMNCDFWHSVECSKSSQYYKLNSEFGKSSPESGGNSLQQQKISSSSINISQENQAIVAPAPIVSTKTSSIVNKQFLATTFKQKPIETKNNFVNRIELTSKQSFGTKGGGKTSPSKQTSFSSFEELRKNSLVSPARKIQSMNNINQQEQNIDSQFVSSSSNQVNMASNKNGINLPIIGSSLIITQEMNNNKKSKTQSLKMINSLRNEQSLSGKINYKERLPTPLAPVNNNQDSEWRPYFKSNSTTTTTTTTQQPSMLFMAENGGSMMEQSPTANQEPTFSSNKDRGESPRMSEEVTSLDSKIKEEITMTPKSGAPPELINSSISNIEFDKTNIKTTGGPSIESDLSSSLTSTTPTKPEADTTTSDSDGSYKSTLTQDEKEISITTTNSPNEAAASSSGSETTESDANSGREESATTRPATSFVEYATNSSNSSDNSSSSGSSVLSSSGASSSPAPTPTLAPSSEEADNKMTTLSSSVAEIETDSSTPGSTSGKKKRKRQSKSKRGTNNLRINSNNKRTSS